jgi:hypothetical protein
LNANACDAVGTHSPQADPVTNKMAPPGLANFFGVAEAFGCIPS